jgi:hypothetical protein
MTEFEAYKIYLALKAHFQTDEYDVVKMRGRIKASRRSFEGLGKEFAFRRLVKVYDKEEAVCNFMVANFISGSRWGGVFDVEAAKQYMTWQRRNQALSYVFEQDLIKLFEEAAEDGVTDIFKHDSGTHPYILKAFLRNTICPETLVILNKITNFIDIIDLADSDPVWPTVRRLIVKYAPFVKVNLEKFKDIYHAHRVH